MQNPPQEYVRGGRRVHHTPCFERANFTVCCADGSAVQLKRKQQIMVRFELEAAAFIVNYTCKHLDTDRYTVRKLLPRLREANNIRLKR